jgi:hypothetical protein
MLEQSTTGAEAVTMIGLLGALGIGPVVNPPVNPLATGADETVSLAAKWLSSDSWWKASRDLEGQPRTSVRLEELRQPRCKALDKVAVTIPATFSILETTATAVGSGTST